MPHMLSKALQILPAATDPERGYSDTQMHSSCATRQQSEPMTYSANNPLEITRSACEDRVLDGPASGEKGSNGRSKLDCIRLNNPR